MPISWENLVLAWLDYVGGKNINLIPIWFKPVQNINLGHDKLSHADCFTGMLYFNIDVVKSVLTEAPIIILAKVI